MIYSSCTEWAIQQRPGNAHSKLLLLILAHLVDIGQIEITHGDLARIAELGPNQSGPALQHLLDLGLVYACGTTQNGREALFAPKGWPQ